jgi:hypothetical protein
MPKTKTCSTCATPMDYRIKRATCIDCRRSATCSVEECNATGYFTRGMCRSHYSSWQRKRKDRPCSVDGCLRQLHAKNLCVNHYMNSKPYKNGHLRVNMTCNNCNREFSVRSDSAVNQKFCSIACVGKSRKVPNSTRSTDSQWAQCAWCLSLHDSPSRIYCSKECRLRGVSQPRKRSELRTALEISDIESLTKALRQDSVVQSNGCWQWHSLDRYGYPRNGLHRSILEVKHQAPLGSQAAHHVCGNRCCVNPAHLQPVTHQDNTAEMLQRRSYLLRIEQLEGRLRELNPQDPLLDSISYSRPA